MRETLTLSARLPIRLGQALKLANVADTGAAASALIEAGRVSVNGTEMPHRGHRLNAGDRVQIGTDGDEDALTLIIAAR